MNKILKSVLAVVLVMCMLPGATIIAAAPVEGAHPDMSILAGGKVVFYRGDSGIEITVTTTALGTVDKVYHKITVNKNNVNLMYKKEYSKSNAAEIDTDLSFNAKNGDIFEVIVDHYAKDGSLIETKTTTSYRDYHN